MRVENIHERALNAPVEKVGELIDSLASANDLLWPVDRWPAMQFDRPLHDALLEDALDRAEAFAGRQPSTREWSAWVRFVRWGMRRRTTKR